MVTMCFDQLSSTSCRSLCRLDLARRAVVSYQSSRAGNNAGHGYSGLH